MKKLTICVASQNPTKVNATQKAFQEVFSNMEITIFGVPSESGVPDQPMGDRETFLGAQNRVSYIKERESADFYIGIEGGLIEHSTGEMEAMAWMNICSKEIIGKARTAGFFIAPETIRLIKSGLELGHADEKVFNLVNTKQKMGSSGLLTKNIISRERFYIDAIILALIPFINSKLFPAT